MSAGRILLLVAGTIAGLAAAALIAAGTTALWADHSKTDKDGYFSSGRQAVSTQTHAFVSDPIDIDDGADWIFDDQGNLTFRIATAGTDGQPVFVGVAPKDAVATYLTGVSYEQVTDIDGDPFRLNTTPHSGTAKPIAPTRAGIWEQSVSGTGTQTLEWKPKQGDWAVVVMNADGSAGVTTQSTFGAKVTFLAEVGLALLAAGLVLLVASVLFVYFALRGRGTTTAGGAAAVPATA
jgi:hypothetical protein